jgi:hypothetical protein
VSDISSNWSADWVWSLPLILFTVLLHAFGLLLIREKIVLKLEHAAGHRRFHALFAIVMGATVLLLTVLHAAEGAAWAFAYVRLGALPDARTAMLYSLSAMTSYGHANLFLAPQWQMMGALEALNGMMLFGLTTAFLFSVIQGVWPMVKKYRN